MRIEPDFAPTPAQPQPAKDGPASRRDVETGKRPRPNGPASESDTRDYDDGAWM